MGNSLRCCLACMLPCGALDVVRVVHLSGHVDEFTCPLIAADVLAAHPSHALTASGSAGAARRIAIVPPDSELRRGRIYFLIPTTACPVAAPKPKAAAELKRHGGACPPKTKRRHGPGHHRKVAAAAAAASTAEQDNYLRELLSEKREAAAEHRRRRSSSGRAGVWRPRLESIAEEPSD